MLIRLDHIGIAVQNIQDALVFFQDALGMELDHVALEEGGKTSVAFMPMGDGELELVQPLESESGLAKFLAKRGEGIHHICFEVDDMDAALARLVAHGAQLIDAKPRVNASGTRYAFIHPKSAHGVLIELYQRA
ncbi:MAG: methylmalonyl-CoA epimerase [Anaerolineae bacterium]|nr:methylmalonyl-CoA epimerase [Anaerolineae bacterium]